MWASTGMIALQALPRRLTALTPACASLSGRGTRCHAATTGEHEVFTCAGIEQAALTMRRRVQLGMGIELVGSQVAKLLHTDIDYTNFLSVSEQAMSNSFMLMIVQIGCVWWYQGFTRDHLLARHVTKISLSKPLSDVAEEGRVVAFVETGPWTHRLEFAAGPGGDKVPFGQLVQLGAIHVDEERGEVLDDIAFEVLTSGHMHIASEQLTADDEAKQQAFVGDYDVMALMQEDTSGTYDWLASLPPFLRRPLLWRGSSAFRNIGILALLMGAGSVVLWLPKGTIPALDRLLQPKPVRREGWY